MEDQLKTLQSELAQLQKELEDMKGVDQGTSSEATLLDLAQKLERLEGNLGVDKVILTDIGDKVQVTIQTPLGTMVFPLGHTPNMKAPLRMSPSSTGSSAGVKGAPAAGMTPDQLQDFKKQTLQINALQGKIKEIEARLTDVNSSIKKAEGVTCDLTNKESDDVKEIFLYLDKINTTMSEKIAHQRIEMEKLAGDTPQPINYDPFNYGEAYAGDVVDFEARKRIIEIKLLLQGLQTAMNQLKDAVRVSPDIDLGYKVVRLDDLLVSSGFAQAIQREELSVDNGLLVSQAANIEPPEKRYPLSENFQTDDNQGSSWAMTDSIMQTLYRLEVELGVLQKTVEGADMGSCSKDTEEPMSTKHDKNKQMDNYQLINAIVEEKIRNLVNQNDPPAVSKISFTRDVAATPRVSLIKPVLGATDKTLFSLGEQVKKLELEVNRLRKKVPSSIDSSKEDYLVGINKHKSYNKKMPSNFYDHPVRLRYLLQRLFRYSVPGRDYEFTTYRLPRVVGGGYEQKWPKPETGTNPDLKNAHLVPGVVEDVGNECLLKGKDGRWYKGDKGPAVCSKPKFS